MTLGTNLKFEVASKNLEQLVFGAMYMARR